MSTRELKQPTETMEDATNESGQEASSQPQSMQLSQGSLEGSKQAGKSPSVVLIIDLELTWTLRIFRQGSRNYPKAKGNQVEGKHIRQGSC